ncbi:MAG: glycoside hydrolase family 127 protein [Clostridia bacterium]|nr:glycoside hydrolase family 127 protein [Clostridia bacterium]
MTEYPYYKKHDLLLPTDVAPRFSGELKQKMRQVTDGLFLKIDFSKTVDIFRNTLDLFAAGEFWGKLMRAACIFYECTGDGALKDVICASMEDMLSVQPLDGEISCTPRASQPNGTHGSDLWERKYVLLGMQAYYRVFGGERVLSAMCRLADYTCAQVGSGLGQVPISETGWAFCGIESSSILEPIVKLYGMTGEAEYLRLAKHIVEETGACRRENIFLAIENGKSPYEIGGNGDPADSIAKAYEMMSCFEGLCEYYRATGEEKWRNIALTFFDRLLAEEITLLGSGGADKPYNLGPGTGEQWNRTKYEQTNPDIDLAQETCVTITWMKLCLQMLRLTGDVRCADEIERSYENALLGAQRPDGAYFDYFPKFDGTRGGKVNFTYNIGDMPLSCCTANGPAGLAALRDAAVMETADGDGTAILLFLDGIYTTRHLTLGCSPLPDETAEKRVMLTILRSDNTEHTLKIRIPGWSAGSAVTVNGTALDTEQLRPENGYLLLCRRWQSGDEIAVAFSRVLRVHPAPHGSNRAGDRFFCMTFGASVMARDKRFDSGFASARTLPQTETVPCTVLRLPGVRCAVQCTLDGASVTLVNYADAGATWDDTSTYRSWIPMK